jgi:hypothetical protein
MPLPTVNDVSPVNNLLSNLSVAYRQEQPAISDMVFPRVVVELQSGSFFKWDKQDRWRRQMFKRAPGDVFKRGAFGNTTDTYRVEQHAMEYKLPDEVRQAGSRNGVGFDTMITSALQEQIALEKDIDFATNFMTSGAGWQSGTLGNGKWSAANSTPVKDIVAAARLLRRTTGSARNYRLVGIGGTIVESALLGNTDISGRLQYVQQTSVSNLRGFIANALGLDSIIFADREYNTAKEGQTASYSPLFDDDFLLLAVPSGPGLETAAPGYTFEWDDGAGVEYVQEYRDETVKSDIYRAVTNYVHKQVDANLGVFFSDAVD